MLECSKAAKGNLAFWRREIASIEKGGFLKMERVYHYDYSDGSCFGVTIQIGNTMMKSDKDARKNNGTRWAIIPVNILLEGDISADNCSIVVAKRYAGHIELMKNQPTFVDAMGVDVYVDRSRFEGDREGDFIIGLMKGDNEFICSLNPIVSRDGKGEFKSVTLGVPGKESIVNKITSKDIEDMQGVIENEIGPYAWKEAIKTGKRRVVTRKR